jgi:hypothetical protein
MMDAELNNLKAISTDPIRSNVALEIVGVATASGSVVQVVDRSAERTCSSLVGFVEVEEAELVEALESLYVILVRVTIVLVQVGSLVLVLSSPVNETKCSYCSVTCVVAGMPGKTTCHRCTHVSRKSWRLCSQVWIEPGERASYPTRSWSWQSCHWLGSRSCGTRNRSDRQ